MIDVCWTSWWSGCCVCSPHQKKVMDGLVDWSSWWKTSGMYCVWCKNLESERAGRPRIHPSRTPARTSTSVENYQYSTVRQSSPGLVCACVGGWLFGEIFWMTLWNFSRSWICLASPNYTPTVVVAAYTYDESIDGTTQSKQARSSVCTSRALNQSSETHRRNNNKIASKQRAFGS